MQVPRFESHEVVTRITPGPFVVRQQLRHSVIAVTSDVRLNVLA